MQSIQSVSVWKILGSFLVVIVCLSEARSTFHEDAPPVDKKGLRKGHKVQDQIAPLPLNDQAAPPRVSPVSIEKPDTPKNRSTNIDRAETLTSLTEVKNFLVENPILLPCMGILAYSFYNRPCFFEFWFAKKPFEFIAGEAAAGFLASSRFPKHWAIPLSASILLSYFGYDFVPVALAFAALLLYYQEPTQQATNQL